MRRLSCGGWMIGDGNRLCPKLRHEVALHL
jgi:hypothetical protein